MCIRDRTVTGSSAEAGDDGEVGRGNRVSGLITPYRPMTMEAAAGKNPVSHVGKLYHVIANRIASRLVAEMPDAEAATCMLVSRIGAPIDQPALVDVRVATFPDDRVRARIHDCLLYTSDAADERSSVDLGGRRIIKKK